MREIARLDHFAEVEMAGREPRHQRLEPRAAFAPGQGTPVLPLDQQRVVEPDESRRLGEHFLAHRLAPEPLLERVEARRAALRALVLLAALRRTAHQQLAIEHRGEGQHLEQFGEGGGNIVARA